MKDERKYHTAKLLNKLKHPLPLNMLWSFSDEITFRQDQMVNSQNNHWLAPSPQDVLVLIKTKYPVHMVFKMVTSNGDIIPPFIFPSSLRLNTDANIK